MIISFCHSLWRLLRESAEEIATCMTKERTFILTLKIKDVPLQQLLKLILMTKKLILGALLLAAGTAGTMAAENQPDSLYLFSYTTAKDNNKTGLHFAWSEDGQRWKRIGNEYSFLKSDYGSWNEEGKRMLAPVLQRRQGVWLCSFLVKEDGKTIALTESRDLMLWKPQDYVAAGAKMGPNRNVKTDKVIFTDGEAATGQIHRVERQVVSSLISETQRRAHLNGLYAEQMKDDGARFAGLKDVTLTITANTAKKKAISPELFGVFFEDINYAADGGLYGELVQNRDFEYSEKELSNVKGWGHTYAWQTSGGAKLEIMTDNPLHKNTPHYAVLSAGGEASLSNTGYDGISIKKGEKYVFSLYGRVLSGDNARVKVSLRGKDGKDIAVGVASLSKKGWKRQSFTMTATESAADATLTLTPMGKGSYALDMVSLFPKNTFKGRENGLRADLAQAIADLKPRFVRFPGGCVAHGNGIDNIYRWKNTIGPLQERIGMRNIWGYRQSMGLGYYEYFTFCEDIGAEPLPVLAAGVPCQNSSVGGYGQQGGIPLGEQMDAYIQDVLDLIEWANGDKSTKWGRLRAEAGHPKPFNLKYIGIGNEDLISEVFKERFKLIYDAVREKHPEIEVIGTVGPFYEGSDYEYGWQFATELQVPVVDEHYYCSPGWFIHNPDFYDSYDRSKSKVYLGEYASHKPERVNDMETALTIANYLTNVERNADVVKLSSYAPLLSRKGHTQWTPDMIYFDGQGVSLTTDYYVQRMFGQNAGSQYIPAVVKTNSASEDVNLRIGQSIVVDEKSGDVIVKLTNLLPVPVKADINLGGLVQESGKATLEVLQGKPSDKTATPKKSAIDVKPATQYEMPAYSLSVIRIAKKQ